MTEQPFTPDIAGDINDAAAATRSRLDAALADTGLSFDGWVALVTVWNATVAHTGPPVSRDILGSTLQARLSADDGAATAVHAGLAAAGLLRDLGETPPGLQLTPAGESTFRGIRDAIARFRADVLDGIPAADLETTRCVLRLIADRTRAATSAAAD